MNLVMSGGKYNFDAVWLLVKRKDEFSGYCINWSEVGLFFYITAPRLEVAFDVQRFIERSKEAKVFVFYRSKTVRIFIRDSKSSQLPVVVYDEESDKTYVGFAQNDVLELSPLTLQKTLQHLIGKMP